MSYDNGLYYMKSVINGISNYKIKTLPKEHLFIKKMEEKKYIMIMIFIIEEFIQIMKK